MSPTLANSPGQCDPRDGVKGLAGIRCPPDLSSLQRRSPGKAGVATAPPRPARLLLLVHLLPQPGLGFTQESLLLFPLRIGFFSSNQLQFRFGKPHPLPDLIHT